VGDLTRALNEFDVKSFYLLKTDNLTIYLF
jgi:hypothetical protein